MNSKLRIVLLFVLLHAQATGARVIHQSRPLQESIANANVVAQVRISKIEERRFSHGGKSASCGTNYVVDVLTTFKGEHQSQRSFSILGSPHALFEHTVKPGDQLLVLLAPRNKGAAPGGEPADLVRAALSREEAMCRETLSKSTLLGGEAGGFPLLRRSSAGISEAQALWVAYNRGCAGSAASIASRASRNACA